MCEHRTCKAHGGTLTLGTIWRTDDCAQQAFTIFTPFGAGVSGRSSDLAGTQYRRHCPPPMRAAHCRTQLEPARMAWAGEGCVGDVGGAAPGGGSGRGGSWLKAGDLGCPGVCLVCRARGRGGRRVVNHLYFREGVEHAGEGSDSVVVNPWRWRCRGRGSAACAVPPGPCCRCASRCGGRCPRRVRLVEACLVP